MRVPCVNSRKSAARGAFGFAQLCSVQKRLVFDAPLGFIVIDLLRRTSFAINGSKTISKCRLLSAIHFLLKHRDTCVGFIFGSAGDCEVSIISVGSTWRVVSNEVRIYRAMAISARLLDVMCQLYPTVAFTRRQDIIPRRILPE